MSPRSPKKPAGRQPTLREVLRPAELIGFAAILAVFVGLVLILATRDWILTVIGLGVAFIVALVVLAMFVLGLKPDAEEQADIAEQNGEPRGH